jgi:hypothetical protein
MPYYPQLVTGSLGQYPITRVNSRRTLVNQFGDGLDIRVADTGASTVAWELTHDNLTQSERDAVQQLFDASFGRWLSFLFLDPTGNLLAWSEDLTQSVWTADPLMSSASGSPDPTGGTAGTQITNGAQAAQQIAQKQPIPASFQYCLSAWIRNDAPVAVEFFGSNGTTEVAKTFTAGNVWTRIAHSFQLGADGDGLTVGLRIQPGFSTSLFGIQLEAQTGAGGYKKTRDRCGVYPVCRFDQDVLQWTATGLNQYGCKVKIVSNVAG